MSNIISRTAHSVVSVQTIMKSKNHSKPQQSRSVHQRSLFRTRYSSFMTQECAWCDVRVGLYDSVSCHVHVSRQFRTTYPLANNARTKARNIVTIQVQVQSPSQNKVYDFSLRATLFCKNPNSPAPTKNFVTSLKYILI